MGGGTCGAFCFFCLPLGGSSSRTGIGAGAAFLRCDRAKMTFSTCEVHKPCITTGEDSQCLRTRPSSLPMCDSCKRYVKAQRAVAVQSCRLNTPCIMDVCNRHLHDLGMHATSCQDLSLLGRVHAGPSAPSHPCDAEKQPWQWHCYDKSHNACMHLLPHLGRHLAWLLPYRC